MTKLIAALFLLFFCSESKAAYIHTVVVDSSTRSIVAVATHTPTLMEPSAFPGFIRDKYNKLLIDMSDNATSDLYCSWHSAVSTHTTASVAKGFQLSGGSLHEIFASKTKPLYCQTDGATAAEITISLTPIEAR